MDTQKRDDNMTASQKISMLEQSKKRASFLARRKSAGSALQNLKDELKKVTWTSKQELVLCTKIVVGSTVFFGFAIYLADVVIRMTLNGLSSIVRYIAG